jgi:hypothetical protein
MTQLLERREIGFRIRGSGVRETRDWRPGRLSSETASFRVLLVETRLSEARPELIEGAAGSPSWDDRELSHKLACPMEILRGWK